ncbi:hypothetical protein LCM08_04010 [Salipiger pacificus]|nr:hypothetical protein [Alloyangia pacifica]
MPNPIPAHVRRVYKSKLKGKGDWIRRSRRARDLLIERHGFKAEDFYVVGKDEDPSLGMHPLYPAHWAYRSKRTGTRFHWVNFIPRGLVIWNPGPDYWGEASDDVDPISMLGDCEFHMAMTDEEERAFLGLDIEEEEAAA